MATLNVADLNRQGKVFVGANVSAKSHIAVTTSMTGLILWNPPSSNRKVILIDWTFAYTTAPAAVHNVGLALAASTTVLPTSLTVAGRSATSADGAGNIPQAVVWDAATLVAAPVAVRWPFGSAFGSSVALNPTQFVDRVDGSIILVPGAAVMTTVVTTTAVGMASFTWAEVPA